MGHYDDLYEQTSQENYDKKVKKAKFKIVESIAKMDIDELEFLADVAVNINYYRTFFRILKKNIK